jgi:hypothetical protein
VRSTTRTGLLLLAACWLLQGCQDWPLYAHLPDPYPDPIPVEEIDVVEDTAIGEDQVQGIGAIQAPSAITITGTIDTCGFDVDDDRFAWPLHPVDEDGDGVADGTGSASGWYAGDVDWYGFTADGVAWLEAHLDWDNAPPGESNAPYQPADEDGAWSVESDLDFVVLTLVDGAPGSILTDVGFSADHPEQTGGLIALEDESTIAVAVGCHHAVATSYTLTLDVLAP